MEDTATSKPKHGNEEPWHRQYQRDGIGIREQGMERERERRVYVSVERGRGGIGNTWTRKSGAMGDTAKSPHPCGPGCGAIVFRNLVMALSPPPPLPPPPPGPCV
jgi:hypothetical protein